MWKLEINMLTTTLTSKHDMKLLSSLMYFDNFKITVINVENIYLFATMS